MGINIYTKFIIGRFFGPIKIDGFLDLIFDRSEIFNRSFQFKKIEFG